VPILTVIAGPNGSGKSTIAQDPNFERPQNLVDPDLIARQMRPDAPHLAAVAAGREALRRIRGCIQNGESFTWETTLSGNGTLETMRSAKERGFVVELVYVCLDDAGLNIGRVQNRVALGGHDIPLEDIMRRYGRSLRNLPEAIRIADRALVWDNSGLELRRVLEARGGKIVWRAPKVPAWAECVLAEVSKER
jgi:predicted ABC-type ATPase